MSQNTPSSLDLSPARWIWLRSQRTLASTFLLFRRNIHLYEQPVSAIGWIAADSRYRLTVNGQRIQWGPAPFDPRHMQADPLDLGTLLKPGLNCLAVEVLYYGHGEGTWPLGKPGFIATLDLRYSDNRTERIVTDENWRVMLDRAHKPGQYRRWFLRALQEEYNAKLRPVDWDTAQPVEPDWQIPLLMDCPADKPPICSTYPDYEHDSEPCPTRDCTLSARSISMLDESQIIIASCQSRGEVIWKRDPEDWFDYRMPESFRTSQYENWNTQPSADGSWDLPATLNTRHANYLTFSLPEQIVGWPCLSIDAAEGTIVELIIQESHDPGQTQWLDSHFYTWTRVICREGLNHFETFDYESVRWIQLHVRNASRPVRIGQVGVRRRIYAWPNKPVIQCDDPDLQSVFEATINTLHNSAQDNCVDGMGRERQPYSGDCGHQLKAIRYTFGESKLPARFIDQYSHGQVSEGYFMDSWPAYDRLDRIGRRFIGLPGWGPILDHSVQFVHDCWDQYQWTGNAEKILLLYPQFLRLATYIQQLIASDGLLPVTELGVACVWIGRIGDSHPYQLQKHKQCAFNLQVAMMFIQVLSPLSQLAGDTETAIKHQQFGQQLIQVTIERFWCPMRRVLINNRPWLDDEPGARLCDRSLALALLLDCCPNGDTQPTIDTLVIKPKEMGQSYPANAIWHHQALAKSGHIQAVIDDYRIRWAKLSSVSANNTLQEFWQTSSDSTAVWSHCATSPLNILFEHILGISPLEPGLKRFVMRPQLGDLHQLTAHACTPSGPIEVRAARSSEGCKFHITIPNNTSGILIGSEQINLQTGSHECFLPL